jgi:hypothetical protein
MWNEDRHVGLPYLALSGGEFSGLPLSHLCRKDERGTEGVRGASEPRQMPPQRLQAVQVVHRQAATMPSILGS